MIIEDDPVFARILLQLAHERGLKAVVSLRGVTALALAREFQPGAVTLDISLPDMAGWTILDQLKHDPLTRHISVHIISGDESRRRALALGAMTYLQKATGQEGLEDTFRVIRESTRPRMKKILIAAELESDLTIIERTLAASDVQFFQAASGKDVLSVLHGQYLDGIVLAHKLRGTGVCRLVEQIQREVSPHTPPMIVFGADGLIESEAREIRRLAHSSLLRLATSSDRLLDESVLLFHRAESALSEIQQKTLASVRQHDLVLAGRKLLVVDDDIRNIFALTSVLEQRQLNVLHAENGRAGIDLLKQQEGIDAVLMDIMMPEMDGYETIRAIRSLPQFSKLPIIALTAKAMKGDREKCLDAGASDYIAKPIDLEQLLSSLRVWIIRGEEMESAGIDKHDGSGARSWQ